MEWKIQDKIVKTINVTQSAIADKNGLWTTVVAAAVLVFDSNGNNNSHLPFMQPTENGNRNLQVKK